MAWLETRESVTAAIAPCLTRASSDLGAGFIFALLSAAPLAAWRDPLQLLRGARVYVPVRVHSYPYMQKPAGHFCMSAGHFFACPRLVLLTMGDGRSTSQYSVVSTSVHHATRCAVAACGSTFQLLEWQTRPWPLECGDLGKGEFLASCYS